MKVLVKNLAIITVGLLLPVFVWAMPATPHQFYGAVNFENGPAPNGLLVEIKIDNVVVESIITSGGRYGYDSVFYVTDPNSDRLGKIIEFYVSGIDSGETYTFSNGASTNLPLTVPGSVGTIEETDENAVIENETIAVTPTQSTNIKLGANLSITISSVTNTNAIIEKIEKLTSDFFTGATAVIAGNNLLNAFEINITGDDLNISVTITYDDTGIDEDTIKPYKFDGTSWVELDFTIDKSANTITFTVSSAETPYAVFGSSEPAPTPPPSSGGGGRRSYTPPPSYETGDSNEDGKVDILDFNSLMIHWGETTTNNIADFNNDNKVDIFDFNSLMIHWTG